MQHLAQHPVYIRIHKPRAALLLLPAVLPGMADKPKNQLVLEAPWSVHLPKFLLWYAALLSAHTSCACTCAAQHLPAMLLHLRFASNAQQLIRIHTYG